MEQARSATTISAVGVRLGLPDHAVTVALATALQESGLRNLSYGDRDSVGVLQQRPSQGWGSRSQILSPAYASAAFYGRLTQVAGWQALPVAQAAQAVQHSADPSAYAQWEDRARVLARSLTGGVVAGCSCRTTVPTGPLPTAALAAAMRSEFGSSALTTAMPSRRAWATANWLVARAATYRLRTVDVADQRWSAVTGAWQQHPAGGAPGVRVADSHRDPPQADPLPFPGARHRVASAGRPIRFPSLSARH